MLFCHDSRKKCKLRISYLLVNKPHVVVIGELVGFSKDGVERFPCPRVCSVHGNSPRHCTAEKVRVLKRVGISMLVMLVARTYLHTPSSGWGRLFRQPCSVGLCTP